MSRACRSLGYLLALALLQAVVLYLALFSPLLPREHPLYMHSYASVPVKYKRLGRSDIQQKLVIVSDITSHFGRDTAVKLAELGFFVLGGVRVESERKAFTGYNAVKGLETFVLNIADPMDMVQMSYRVSQIEQKYSRSLYGIVIVDTYQTGDVSVSSSQWTKQKKLQKKLQLSNSGNESSVITPQEKEQLFHMNTRDYFDLHEMHTKYQNVFQGPYRLLQVCHDLASNHPQGVDFRVTYLRPAIVSSNLDRGSLFSDDLISHSEAFLESKEIDETAVSNMTSSLAVVEYAATPPKTFFAPKPSKNKRGAKSSKKRVQRVSSQDQEVSTTSTPSPVTTDDVSLAIIHSFAAERPLNRYLLGSIKLNFTLSPMVCPGWSELPGTCANSVDETCENIALSQLILDTVEYIMTVMLYYIRMFLGNLLEWSDVQVVMVPLASIDLLVYVLPPFVSDYLWQLVGPCITGVA